MRSIFRGLTIVGALGLAAISLNAQGAPPAGAPTQPGVRASVRAGRAGVPAGVQAGARARQARPLMAMRARAIQRRAAARGVQLGPRQIRNRMIAQRAAVRQRLRSLTPEQRQSLQAGRAALRTQRQGIGAQLRAGTLTREQARQQMQAWRKEHRPLAALRGKRPPGGGFDR